MHVEEPYRIYEGEEEIAAARARGERLIELSPSILTTLCGTEEVDHSYPRARTVTPNDAVAESIVGAARRRLGEQVLVEREETNG